MGEYHSRATQFPTWSGGMEGLEDHRLASAAASKIANNQA
jgi:hypothetical protein